MKNGLYALASLSGAPLDPASADLILAGLPSAPVRATTFAAKACDPQPEASARHDAGPCADLFVGHLDDPGGMRLRLGLHAHANAAEIAAAAQDRWGVEAARDLWGEWTLMRWDSRTATLVLLMSQCRRDDCYYAVSQGMVAVAPQLVRLARLPSVDGSFDPDGLARTMGQYVLERTLGDRTLLKGVKRLLPGTQVTLRHGDSVTETLAPPAMAAARQITFDEAVHEVEALLRQIVRRRLADGRNAAFLLSGGLDSSLLAWLAAEECGPQQRLHFLSSAAPEGSGIPDETGWAASVADQLGRPLIPVRPSPDADVYAPTDRMLASREGPILSPRHYLYEAFEQAALVQGASVIFDGVYGELTVTNPGLGHPRHTPWRVRLVRGLKAMLSHPPVVQQGGEPFHVCLSAGLRQQVQGLATTEQEPDRRSLVATDPFGYAAGWDKSALPPTIMGDRAVRYAMPFRDRRLLALFATLPVGFMSRAGMPRAIGRAILEGRLPDRIVSRTTKMPFSPTYPILLERQAGAARERLAAQREAGAADWLDLDWLDQALAQVARGDVPATRMQFRIQATAMAAEFFRWWRDQDIRGA